MRKSLYDDFIYFCEETLRIIIVKRDYAVNGKWQHWHFDGEKCWWTEGSKILKTWVLIERLPEGSLKVPIVLPW